jgi:hypothetical protein
MGASWQRVPTERHRMGQLTQFLEVSRPDADMTHVTAHEVRYAKTPFTTLRLVAVIGSLAAAVLIVAAFGSNLVFGLVALAISPMIPLGLVLAVDRVLGR